MNIAPTTILRLISCVHDLVASEASAEFSISYEGPALAGGSMDVEVLMRSLLALDALMGEANEVLNPDVPPVHLDICGFSVEEPETFTTHLKVVQE